MLFFNLHMYSLLKKLKYIIFITSYYKSSLKKITKKKVPIEIRNLSKSLSLSHQHENFDKYIIPNIKCCLSHHQEWYRMLQMYAKKERIIGPNGNKLSGEYKWHISFFSIPFRLLRVSMWRGVLIPSSKFIISFATNFV